MKNNDKILIGIVAGIVLLVVFAFFMILSQPEPQYRADDTPDAIVHNYLLALQKEEYARAYDYLPHHLDGYPTSVESFIDDVNRYGRNFRLDDSTSVSIVNVRQTGTTATVKVRESRFEAGGLFDSGKTTNEFEVRLAQIEGQWKIIDSWLYFASCWQRDEGCD